MKGIDFKILFLFIIISSCSPTKRLNRLIRKNPELINRVDTIKIQDTVFYTTDRVFTDSAFLIQQKDTVIIKKENLTIRQYIYGDSVYISGECDTIIDTLIKTINVPYPVIEYTPRNRLDIVFRWLFWISLVLFCVWLIRNNKFKIPKL